MKAVCTIDDIRVCALGLGADHIVHLTMIAQDVRMKVELRVLSRISGDQIASEIRKEAVNLLASKPMQSLASEGRPEDIDLVLVWSNMKSRPRRPQGVIQSDSS